MSNELCLRGLTNALQPARRAWFQAASRAAAGVGLSSSLSTILVLVARLGPQVRQHVLAAEAGINPAALVRLLQQAETAGLVRRRAIAGDRRGKVIELSPEGVSLAARLETEVDTLRGELLGCLTPDDVRTATRVLRVLEDSALTWMRHVR